MLTTDGLLECPHTNFYLPEQVVAMVKDKSVRKGLQQLLNEIQVKGVRDSTTILAWDQFIIEEGTMPSDI